MILVDTTVVIDYARGNDPKLNALIPTVVPAICGIGRAELLCGARDPAHRAMLQTLLATFHQVPIPDSLWDAVGDHLAALRRHGLTLSLADMVIAELAIHHDLELWQRDRHFVDIQRVLPALRLFREPP